MTAPPLALVQHGPPALDALAAQIAALKADDPLRAVTVAVPHPWAGLSLRRALAARPGGVANVNFLVLARAAELVGSPSLAAAQRRPRTATVTRSAVRAVLRARPGRILHAVAEHPATEAAVTRLVDDLCSVGAEGRARIARSGPRAADLVALVERVVDAAPDRYDRHDLVRAAAAAVRQGTAGADELGQVVVHLPPRLSPAEVELVEALAERGRVHVLLGTTGHDAADQLVLHLAERLAPSLGPPVRLGPHGPPPRAQRVVTATDPDDEVRAALRCVIEAWDAGTPLDRIAVVHPVADPYARLVHEQAAAAGLPIAGRSTTTLAGSVAGRTLLGALALPDADLARDEVCDWMAAAPLRTPDGRPVPASRWDDLSRQAGVVTGGLVAWDRHLDALRDRLTERTERVGGVDDEQRERLALHQRRIEELRSFVGWLDGQLHALDAAPTWTAKAQWATRFLRAVLGPEPSWEHWPDEQVVAAQSVLEALDRLGALDEVEPGPTTAAFRRALGAELDAAFGRVGEVGRGALVLPLRDVVGLDLDLVVVLGLAEGTLPGRTSDDALLPDADRAVLGPDLPRRADAVVDQHHHLLAALAAAPRRILLMPRGDLRQSRVRIPSRWLLDSVSATAGRRVTTAAFDEPHLAGITRVPSFAAGILAAADHPVSLHEHDLAALLRWTAAGRRAHEHPLVAELPGLASGFEVLRARRRGGFNRFTGRVDGVRVPTFKGGVALSPTALERWAACPRRYFFAQVLRVGRRDTPEVIDRISALDRGNLVHEVLDRFIGEVIARPEPKPPAEPWTEADHARLDEITTDVCRAMEDEGVVGRGVLWELDRNDIRRELHRFLRHDDRHRAARGATPVATELPFGPDQPTGAVMDLPGGRRLSFKGFADRVDRAADGTLIVLDYKTGRLSDEVKAIERGDPVVGGTKLQLPVYALAAATAHGDPAAPVHAAYWHISSREGFAQVGYGRTPEVEARVTDVLTRIADGIEGGVFPAYPGDTDTYRGGFTNCTYCDFDAVCGRDRLQEWEQVRDDPAVTTFVELRGLAPDPDDVPDAGAAGARP